jgi:hypothetical protein
VTGAKFIHFPLFGAQNVAKRYVLIARKTTERLIPLGSTLLYQFQNT